MVIELKERAPRVRFKHPVRVVPLDGSPRIYRTLAANLSRKGMFVRMPEPLPKGTRVALSLEAGGQALPFAEAEVAWCRVSESGLPGRYTGFGVRFTSFLNPRAPELVEYLVKNLDTGRPLKRAPSRSRRGRQVVAAAAVVSVLVGLVALGLARSSSSGSAAPEGTAPLVPPPKAPQVAVAAPAPAPVTVVDRPAEPAPPIDVVEAAPEAAADEPAPAEVALAEPVAPDEGEDEREPLAPREAAGAEAVPVAAAPEAAADVEAEPEEAVVEPPAVVQAPTAVVAAPPVQVAPASKHGRLSLASGGATALSWDARGPAVQVRLALAPGVTAGKPFLLSGPPRLVLDLEGKAPQKSYTVGAEGPWLTQVRVGRHGSATRVVVDLAQAPEALAAADDGATLTFAR